MRVVTRHFASSHKFRFGCALLLFTLAACTTLDQSRLAPEFAALSSPANAELLPIKPQLGQTYGLMGDDHHNGGGHDLSENTHDDDHHVSREDAEGHMCGLHGETESDFVKSKSVFLAPLTPGVGQPAEQIALAALDALAIAYGPVDADSMSYAVLPMLELKTADNNARSITFIADEAPILVLDFTGEFEPSQVPYGTSPDKYKYLRAYLDAVNGAKISVLLSKTPLDGKITPVPTPRPSALPTSIPTSLPSTVQTPTPTPVPTASPPPPINPSTLTQAVYSFDVDDAGNVYLMGRDPVDDGTPTIGRIIKVPAGAGTVPSLFYDNTYAVSDIAIDGDLMLIPMTLQPARNPWCVTYLDMTTMGQRYAPGDGLIGFSYALIKDPYAAPRTDPRENYWHFQAGNAGQLLAVYSNVAWPWIAAQDPNWLFDNEANNPNYSIMAARSVEFLGPRDPVWTAAGGLMKRGGEGLSTVPVVCAPLPAGYVSSSIFGRGYIGLAPRGDGKFFTTLESDKDLYLWDPTVPGAPTKITPNPIPDGSYPRFMRRGADGIYWLMTLAGASTLPGTYQVLGSAQYKIMRFDLQANGALTYRDTRVATF